MISVRYPSRIAIFLTIILAIPLHKLLFHSNHSTDNSRKINLTINDTHSKSSDNQSEFLQTLHSFPWTSLISSYKTKRENPTGFTDHAKTVLFALSPYLAKPPIVSVNQSCHPPPLRYPDSAPACRPLQKRRKLATLFPLALEADTLEILMHELDTLVDKYFILEATKTHHMAVQKPLVWEQLQTQERFQPFLDKVVHFVLDDGDIFYHHWKKDPNSSPYELVQRQEEMLWLKFLRWNAENENYFGDDDLIGFSDLDEVPNRNTVHYMKQCELPSDPVDIGIWFPFGNVNQAFQSDYPVKFVQFSVGAAYTFSAPTFWTFKTINNTMKGRVTMPEAGFRRRGNTASYLLGGMHMTDYAYIPAMLGKLMTMAERPLESVYKLESVEKIMTECVGRDMGRNCSEAGLLERIWKVLTRKSDEMQNRIISLSEFKLMFPAEFGKVVKLPWFYACNRERYPGWEGKQDSRLL